MEICLGQVRSGQVSVWDPTKRVFRIRLGLAGVFGRCLVSTSGGGRPLGKMQESALREGKRADVSEGQ